MTEPCADCGSTTYVVSLVSTEGVVTCGACWIGLTPLVRAGVPIAATVAELGPKDRK